MAALDGYSSTMLLFEEVFRLTKARIEAVGAGAGID